MRNRASAAQWNNVSIFLRDLVAMANLAYRAHRGDFMFCGWQPHGAGQEDSTSDIRILRSGTMLTMVTKRGFADLREHWNYNPFLREPGHVDLCMKKFFWKHPRDGCSYFFLQWEDTPRTCLAPLQSSTPLIGRTFGWRNLHVQVPEKYTIGIQSRGKGNCWPSLQRASLERSVTLMWRWTTRRCSGSHMNFAKVGTPSPPPVRKMKNCHRLPQQHLHLPLCSLLGKKELAGRDGSGILSECTPMTLRRCSEMKPS